MLRSPPASEPMQCRTHRPNPPFRGPRTRSLNTLSTHPQRPKPSFKKPTFKNGSNWSVCRRRNATLWRRRHRLSRRWCLRTCTSQVHCSTTTLTNSRPQPFSAFWHPPGAPPSRDTPHSNTYASLSINLIHPIRATQLAISHFLSHSPPSPTQPKCVIHISSIAGQTAPFLNPIYNATKHGINGFVRSLALLEERKGIRVAAVAPGVIKTLLWTDHPEKMRMVTEADV